MPENKSCMNTYVAKQIPSSTRKFIAKKFRKGNVKIKEISINQAVYEITGCDSDETGFWETCKVSMFRDGRHVYVYGSYGTFDFDNLSWTANPTNMRYDNVPYLFEKLSPVSAAGLKTYHADAAKNDILGWLKDILSEETELSDYKWKMIVKYLGDRFSYSGISELCPSLDDFSDLVDAAAEILMDVSDRDTLLSSVNDHRMTLEDYDAEYYMSSLKWGMQVNENVWISLFALSILGSRMPRMKRGEGEWRVMYGKKNRLT